MRLIACRNCHAQYDVSQVAEAEIRCRCGGKLSTRALEGVDAKVRRCGSCGAQLAGGARSCNYCGAEIVRDPAALCLICPECFARNHERSRFCSACAVAFDPEPLQTDGHELPCPCCGCLMPVRRIGGVGMNECPDCNGIWVPENRFDELVAKACEAARARGGAATSHLGPRVAGANPARTTVVYRKCPVCDGLMRRSNFRHRSGVIIDRCPSHGTWLDADELERIAGFILERGSDAGRHEEELEATRRREAAALMRATRHQSIVIGAHRPTGAVDTVVGLLKTLLG